MTPQEEDRLSADALSLIKEFADKHDLPMEIVGSVLFAMGPEGTTRRKDFNNMVRKMDNIFSLYMDMELGLRL